MIYYVLNPNLPPFFATSLFEMRLYEVLIGTYFTCLSVTIILIKQILKADPSSINSPASEFSDSSYEDMSPCFYAISPHIRAQ